MGAIKNYYHDQICEREDDPQADYPNPAEEQWWKDMNSDKEYIKEQEADNENEA